MGIPLRSEWCARTRAALAALGLATASSARAQVTVPIRQLSAPVAISSLTFTNPMQVRALSDGRVMVNDPSTRRVTMLDGNLASPRVVFDSVRGQGNSYGSRLWMIPLRGDSTLVVDIGASALLVVDPAGVVRRTIALPPGPRGSPINAAPVASYLSVPSAYGYAGVDVHGRLIHQVPARRQSQPIAASLAGTPNPNPIPDSAFIVAANLDTRKVDTIGSIRIALSFFDVPPGSDPRRLLFQTVDQWAVTSDGIVAFIRGRNYHVDLLGADGSRTSSVRIPYEWVRLSDDDKARKADSISTARDSLTLAMMANPRAGMRPMFDVYGGAAGWIDAGVTDGVAPRTRPPVIPVPPSSIPDYMPPFKSGAVMPDADGNIWITSEPTALRAGGTVYDIVNRDAKLIDRLQFREGHPIVGFGVGGIVYTAPRDGGVAHLEKYRWR